MLYPIRGKALVFIRSKSGKTKLVDVKVIDKREPRIALTLSLLRRLKAELDFSDMAEISAHSARVPEIKISIIGG